MARHRQTVIEQLVDGLVMGAMFGPGILIVGREVDRIEFKQAGPILQSALQRGEILISDDERGETKVEFKIWCNPRWLIAVLLGVLAGWWVGHVEGGFRGVVFGCALMTGIIIIEKFVVRARLKRQLETYLHNLIYLKAM